MTAYKVVVGQTIQRTMDFIHEPRENHNSAHQGREYGSNQCHAIDGHNYAIILAKRREVKSDAQAKSGYAGRYTSRW